MSELVHYQARDGVVLLVVDNPPVNALSPGVPEALQAAVERANVDSQVNSIAVIGAGRTFMAGADIKEITKPDIRLYLKSLLDCARAMEDSAKPVVMAMHGTAFGAGLEIAMGGHYRILLASAQVGQPEVKLGLIPGAGGTQRLPRLAGIKPALEMCAFGEPVSAQKALEIGLVDEVFEGDVAEAAVAAARRIAGRKFVKTRERDEKVRVERSTYWLQSDIFAVTRANEVMPQQLAPIYARDAVVAAVRLPFDEGLKFEADLFEKCRSGPDSRALIHLFFAERNAGKVPDVTAETKTSSAPVVVTNAAPAGPIKNGVICFDRSGSRLCEIIRAVDAAPEDVRAALEWAKKHGKVAVVVREAVSERLLRRYVAEEEACLREGFSEKQVSEAMLDFGFGVARVQLLARPDANLAQRVVAAMADEGAQILAEGHALRASDIDVISVLGCGFPAWRGGVMLYAAVSKH